MDGDRPQVCWFCGAENDPERTICGFCNHRLDEAA